MGRVVNGMGRTGIGLLEQNHFDISLFLKEIIKLFFLNYLFSGMFNPMLLFFIFCNFELG